MGMQFFCLISVSLGPNQRPTKSTGGPNQIFWWTEPNYKITFCVVVAKVTADFSEWPCEGKAQPTPNQLGLATPKDAQPHAATKPLLR